VSGPEFVHLHCHTEYSMLDGAARVPELLDECQRLGMDSLAITDHGNMFGAYDFYVQARKRGIRPIIGVEAYLTPRTSRFDRTRVQWNAGGEDDVSGGGAFTHLTLLAQTTAGMHNLFRLSSLASIEGFFYKPRMDLELLSRYSDGIIAFTGCPSGEVQTWLRIGRYGEALKAAATLRDIFGQDNLYVELMDHGLPIETRVKGDLLRLARDLGLPLVATNDLHYTRAEDAAAHEALLCVQSGSTLADPKRFKFDASTFYLQSPAQMHELFADVPEACQNTLAVAERCHVEFAEGADLMPRFEVPAGETEATWLAKEVDRGLHRRFGATVPDQARTQAAYETSVVTSMGFPGYFLVVSDFIRWAKEQGIRVGPGRGSAAGSIVAYALGITDLNPLEHGLLFERFLNPERVSKPDIDIDFDERRRGDVIAYVTDKYGAERVAQIVTFGTIKAKQAIKDSARVLGYPYALGDKITKAYPASIMGKDVPLSGVFDGGHERYAEAAEFRALYDSDPDVARVVDIAKGLENLKRQWGVHAAGVIMSREPLIDLVPIMRREQDGAIITQFDNSSCDALGLLKMDFLGLRNLTVLDDALANVRVNRGTEVVLETLALDDPATYELLARGDTLGVFQLDGAPMRALLRAMKPDSFADISAVLALYRPGPMGANSHTNYALRKNGLQPITPIHPELEQALEPILGETHGLCVTGDTLVWDATTGQRVRIDSIGSRVADGAFRTFGVAKDGTVCAADVTHWIPTGAKRVLRVATASGHTVRLSEDHPVLTPSGWRKAGELLAGVDRVAVPKTPHDAEQPDRGLTVDQARLLGYLIGDGYLTLYQNSLISGSPELLADAAERVRRAFPDCHPVLRQRGTEVRGDGHRRWADRLDLMASPPGIGRGRGAKGGRYDRLSLNVWLRDLGFARRTTAAHKFVPDAVFRADRATILQFLAGLWDTDGHVGPEVAFLTTISSRLANDVQALLGRLGILARVRADAPYATARGTSTPYRVQVYGEAFWDLVVPHLVVPAKRAVVKARTAQARTSDGINGELMLARMSDIVRDDPALRQQTRRRLRESGRLGVKATFAHLSRLTGHDVRSYSPPLGSDGAYMPLGRAASAYLDAFGGDEDWLYARQNWTMILAIEDDGVEEMFDITVEGLHTFLANGLVVHNCIYQEQVMAIAQQLAGYSLGSADLLRRAMGKKKKEILDKEYLPFAAGMRANGYSDESIKALWDILVPFSDYAFNKAHTAGYGLVSYWTAYLKANFPAEYMAALLTSIRDDKDKSALYLNECRRMGIKVLPPDVNESHGDFTPVGTDIRFGLTAIRNVGSNVVDAIIGARSEHGRFGDFGDFMDAVPAVVCNKRVVESLIKAGAFDSFGYSRRSLLAVHEDVVEAVSQRKRNEAIGQFDLFAGAAAGADPSAASIELTVVDLPEWEKSVRLGYEREMLGLYVSDHPLMGLEPLLATLTDRAIAGLVDETAVPSGSVVTISGLASAVQRRLTRRGDTWAVVTLEDLEGSVDVVVFPALYATVGARLAPDAVLVVKGRVDRRDEGLQVIASQVNEPDLSQAQLGPVVLSVPAVRCTPPLVGQLREVLASHPGTTEVHLRLEGRGRTTVMRLDDGYRVLASPALMGDLKALLGPGCLVTGQ